MPYFNVQNSASDNSFSLRQAEGKVLGRIRPMVKVSTPQPGVRDYRFFADPLSPLPPEFDEETPFGFTGFMSRCGYGYNAFETEDAALAALQKDFGDFFVTFTPALRNNKFYVLDDIKKEGRTFYMDQDEDYIP
ncbi:MAG: restriction endonuclease, partial [Dialister sp.]|nr:restriction endonuclease [Dialister sp.]